MKGVYLTLFIPFTAKYPSLELIITKILAKREKLVYKLPKSQISLDSFGKKAF